MLRKWKNYKSILGAAALTAVAIAATLGTPTVAHASYYGYSDIPANHWAAQSHVIDYAVDRGLLSGYSGTDNWGPDDPVTRGQMAVIMYRICVPEDAYDFNTALTDNDIRPFHNVNGWVTGRYYEDAMNWANLMGLIKGNGYIGLGIYSDNRGVIYPEGNQPSDTEPYVRADDNITREELVVMLQRLAEHRGNYSSQEANYTKLDSMADAESVSSWARDSMAWAVGKGIITGKPGNRIDPQGTTTRAEASKMLMVYMKGADFDPTEHEKVWVDTKLYISTPTWTCFTVLGNGCGASSDISRDAIQHKPSCGIWRGEDVLIAESWSDLHWVDVATANEGAKNTALRVCESFGLLKGWYDYV